jgi:uncharacterized protein YlxW (UPF0749 family)
MCPCGYYEAEKGETGRVELMSNFKSIVERIRTLESERKNLMLEIDELKKMANSKAGALESEVSMLKDEVKSLRVLLGGDEPPEEKPEVDPAQKKRQTHK